MTATRPLRRSDESGYTLIEMIVSLGILLVVSGVVMDGVNNLAQLSASTTNRTDMFAAIRNASALLQQEVGQAGRIILPGAVTLDAAVATGAQTVGVTSTGGMFVGEWLDIGTGATRETVAVTAINTANDTLTATFEQAHAANAPVQVAGGFASGVVPDDMANGSSAAVLKIFGDINGNGQMVYVEYTCDTANNRLIRNSMDFDAGAKAAVTVDKILVENLQPNPGNAPCFTYQEKVVNGTTYVIGVAITLTVQSDQVDPVTKKFQTESKALLNVSPRNVFMVWQMASLNILNRVQPMPPSVAALLP